MCDTMKYILSMFSSTCLFTSLFSYHLSYVLVTVLYTSIDVTKIGHGSLGLGKFSFSLSFHLILTYVEYFLGTEEVVYGWNAELLII